MMKSPSSPVRSDTKAGRWYDVDDHRLPSVTSILSVVSKPALVQWAAKEERKLVSETAADLYADLAKTPPMNRLAYLTTLEGRVGKQRANQKVLAKAADIGSQVHTMAEWNFRRALGQRVGPEPKIEDRAQWAFMALQDWASSVEFKPLLIEQTVYSLTYGYAGTMDLLGEVNGEPTLVDLKTGKAIYAEAYVQNVAYQVALTEMGHMKPAGGIIVRLPKIETDPAFETAVVPPVAELLPVFLAAKRLWEWWVQGELTYQAKREAAKAVDAGVPPSEIERAWIKVRELMESHGKDETWLRKWCFEKFTTRDLATLGHDAVFSVVQYLGTLDA